MLLKQPNNQLAPIIKLRQSLWRRSSTNILTPKMKCHIRKLKELYLKNKGHMKGKIKNKEQPRKRYHYHPVLFSGLLQNCFQPASVRTNISKTNLCTSYTKQQMCPWSKSRRIEQPVKLLTWKQAKSKFWVLLPMRRSCWFVVVI